MGHFKSQIAGNAEVQELQSLVGREVGALEKNVKSVADSAMGKAGEPSQAEYRAKMAPRRFTDLLALLILILCLTMMGWLVHYAVKNGDIRRLHHGFDFLGHMCGVGDYSQRPYLFYCTSPGDILQLDLQHPICISSCPKYSDTWHSCYVGTRTQLRETDAVTGSYQETLDYEFDKVWDYSSYSIMGRYCIPTSLQQYEQIKDVLMKQYGSEVAEMVLEVSDSWEALIVAAIVSFACGFLYLYSLEKLAHQMVYIMLTLPCLLLFMCGATFISNSRRPEIEGYAETVAANAGFLAVVTTGTPAYDLWLGIGLAVLGLIYAVAACCFRQSIEVAISCVSAACECLRDMPSLMLVPALNVGTQFVVFMLTFWGFMYLVSCGNVKEESMAHYVTTPMDSTNIRGVMRSFKYKDEEYYYLGFYAFMMIWLVEIVGATYQFMLIYSVQIWYFVPYESNRKRDIPLGVLLRGAAHGVFFHLGSLAAGAFLVALLRIARLIGTILTKQQENQQNAVGATIAKGCTCFLDCFERFVRQVNKNAYMDVSMHSNTFCVGTGQAFQLLTSEMSTVAFLNGVTWILTVAGIGALAAGGMASTYVIVRCVPWFADPGQEMYVPNPGAISIVAGIISAGIAWNFMMVFDTVSDTILFCYVIDKQTHSALFNWDTYAPPGLKKLLDADASHRTAGLLGKFM